MEKGEIPTACAGLWYLSVGFFCCFFLSILLLQLGLFVGEGLPGNRLCGQFRNHEGEGGSADEHIRPGSQNLGRG